MQPPYPPQLPYQPPQQPGQPYYPSPSGGIPPQVSGPVYPTGYAPQGQMSQPFPPQYQQPYPPGYYPPQQYQQPPYPYPYPYQQPNWPPSQRINSKASLAQTLGFCSLFLGVLTGIPAIIVGMLALGEIHDTGEAGTNRANAGIILGIISFVWMVGYYYWFFVPR